MKKITFENKLTSLDINSKYVISSVDVNEIKTVINSISDALLEKIQSSNEKYKYIFIKLPKNIVKKYDIEIETSIDNWEDNINSLKLSTDANKFFIFDNGIFKNFENEYILRNESGKTIVIDIKNLIISPSKTLCRFRFKNITSFEYTDYFSVDLNVNTKINEITNFIGYKFFTVANLKYKDHICKLLDFGFDLEFILNSINYTFDEKTEIELYSFIYDGISITDVTSLTSYSSTDNELIINNSSIQPIKTQTFKRFNINSSINYKNELLVNKINICLNPIYLCDIEATFDSINYLSDPYQVEFYAKYSNQTFLNIKNDENFEILIKNNNFYYDQETGILSALIENSTDEITIKYRDHDFQSEYLEKTYTLKIEGVKLFNIVGKIEKEFLTSIDNKTNYSVSAFYSDGSIIDITNNENLEITIFNNKIKNYNTLTLNKENSEIITNEILYDENKYISFSMFDEKSNKVIHTINKITLSNSSIYSFVGKMITSNGSNLFYIPIKSELKSFEEIKQKTTLEDLSDYKKIQNLTYDVDLDNNNLEYDLNKFTYNNKNCYYKANIYLNLPINDKLLLKSVVLPNTFDFYNDKIYKVEFTTISKMPGAKFSKDVEIEINKNFDENYIIGFQTIKFPIIDNGKRSYYALELIGLSGIFESSVNYEFEKSFIYDERHDLWLIDSTPLRGNKLKKLKMNFSYLEDEEAYPWISWNSLTEYTCGYKGFRSNKIYRYKITTDWDRSLYSNGYIDNLPYAPSYKVDGHYITEIIYDETEIGSNKFKEIVVESSKELNPENGFAVGDIINQYDRGIITNTQSTNYNYSDCFKKTHEHEEIILTNDLYPSYGISNLTEDEILMLKRKGQWE